MDTLKHILNFDKQKSKNYLEIIKNGRINIMGKPIKSKLYPLYEQPITGDAMYNKEALKTIQYDSKVSTLFFSDNNINNLQQIMRYRVWIESGKKHIIGRQSDGELKIVMRSIFLQYGKYRNTKIIDQVKELNQIVCQYTIPNILSNIEQYIGYKKDLSFLPKPLALPENLSIKGTKLYQ